MAAIPDALIDTVSLCGPPDVVRERLADLPRRRGRHARRHPDRLHRRRAPGAAAPRRRARGSLTSLVRAPAGALEEERERKRETHTPTRTSRRVLLGAFGDPGHAFPMIALGRALARARPRRHAADLAALAGAPIEAEGMVVRGGARARTCSRPGLVSRWTSTRRSCTRRRTSSARARAVSGTRSSRTSSSPRRSPAKREHPRRDVYLDVYPENEPDFLIYPPARPPRTAAGRRACWCACRADPPWRRARPYRAEPDPRASGLPASKYGHAGSAAAPGARGDVPGAGEPRAAAVRNVVGPLVWEPPARRCRVATRR